MNSFIDNKRLNQSEMDAGKSILSSRFTSLICTLDNRCNIQCIMCGVWRHPWTLPERIFHEIMASLPYLEHVIWLGGEVFLSPYFSEILEETKKYPYLEQRINTNALLIDEMWAGKLARNNVELICSIDGATPQTYEHIRKGGRFDDLLRALNIIRETKKNNKNFRIRMNVVVMRSNYRELEKIMDLAAEYGFENVQLIGLNGEDGPEQIFTDTAGNRAILSELDIIVGKLRRKAEECNIELLNCLPLHVSGNTGTHDSPGGACGSGGTGDAPDEGCFCRLPWQQLLIEPYGLTRFGCWCPEPLGNIVQNTMSELWNSEVAQRYRKKIVTKTFDTCCDKKCLAGEIPRQLREVNEFYKKNPQHRFSADRSMTRMNGAK